MADLCIALLKEPLATGVTFEVKSTIPFSQAWEGNSGTARDWKNELKSAGLLKGVTGKTINGVYTGKQQEAALPAAKPAQGVAA